MRPRIRTVKPEFFKHEELFDAEDETGLPLRLAFIGLWTMCDREGRFQWRPRALKADVMPYDDVDFARVLDALMTRGFVVKYASNGKEYGFVPGFSRHQVVNNRESASEIPEPPEGIENIAVSTPPPREDDASLTRHDPAKGEGKGREGKGKEEAKASPPKRKTRIPEGAVITDGMVRAAEKRGHPLTEAEAQFEKFKNDALAKGKLFVDWDRAFITWLDSDFFKPITTGGQNGQPAYRSGGDPRGMGHSEKAQEYADFGARYAADRAARG